MSQGASGAARCRRLGAGGALRRFASSLLRIWATDEGEMPIRRAISAFVTFVLSASSSAMASGMRSRLLRLRSGSSGASNAFRIRWRV